MPLNRFGRHYLNAGGASGGGGGDGTVRHYHFNAPDLNAAIAASTTPKGSGGSSAAAAGNGAFNTIEVFETLFSNRETLMDDRGASVQNMYEMSLRLKALLNEIRVLEAKVDVQGKRLANLGEPVEPGDAVTLGYLDTRYRRKGASASSGHPSSQGVGGGGAASLASVATLAAPHRPAGGLPLSGKPVASSASGVAPAASSRPQGTTQTETSAPGGGAPHHKRVTNVGDPRDPYDAINLRFFIAQMQALIEEVEKRTLYHTTAGTFTADGKRIQDVADPVNDHDAVTVSFLREYVSQFVTYNATAVASSGGESTTTTSTSSGKRKKLPAAASSSSSSA